MKQVSYKNGEKTTIFKGELKIVKSAELLNPDHTLSIFRKVTITDLRDKRKKPEVFYQNH